MPLLFSYGTLQQEGVQRSTFGRLLKGEADALVGYAQTMVRIEDADVVAKSGKTHHPIVAYSGRDADRVSGTVFEITDAELAAADAYEVDAYKRVGAAAQAARLGLRRAAARDEPSATRSREVAPSRRSDASRPHASRAALSAGV